MSKSTASAILYILLLAQHPIRCQLPDGAAAKTHVLKPTPKTVVVGYFDPASKPALKVKSGDTVEMQTLLAGSPERLRSAFLPAEEIEPALLDIFKEVKDKGPGGHILTGPIHIDGAEPGDTLEVRIQDIKLAIPYGYTGYVAKRGFLPEDFDRQRIKIVRLDEKRMVGHFAPGIEIPLRPFFGCLGVAPPPAAGRISSGPPGVHAGNLDNKELVAGTKLFI